MHFVAPRSAGVQSGILFILQTLQYVATFDESRE